MLCRNSLAGPKRLLADNGYFSEANVMACTAANIEPLIATGGSRIIPPGANGLPRRLRRRKNPTLVEAMAWRLRTGEPPAGSC
jgi:hypothetical protein